MSTFSNLFTANSSTQQYNNFLELKLYKEMKGHWTDEEHAIFLRGLDMRPKHRGNKSHVWWVREQLAKREHMPKSTFRKSTDGKKYFQKIDRREKRLARTRQCEPLSIPSKANLPTPDMEPTLPEPVQFDESRLSVEVLD